MLHSPAIAIRQPCPPGACECEREALLEMEGADVRILRLTREEEKALLARIEAISSYEQLQRMVAKLQENLGVTLRITPSTRGVRTIMGLNIQLERRPGLCRKTRQAIPAAVRRCLGQHEDIVFAILDAHDLLGAP